MTIHTSPYVVRAKLQVEIDRLRARANTVSKPAATLLLDAARLIENNMEDLPDTPRKTDA